MYSQLDSNYDSIADENISVIPAELKNLSALPNGEIENDFYPQFSTSQVCEKLNIKKDRPGQILRNYKELFDSRHFEVRKAKNGNDKYGKIYFSRAGISLIKKIDFLQKKGHNAEYIINVIKNNESLNTDYSKFESPDELFQYVASQSQRTAQFFQEMLSKVATASAENAIKALPDQSALKNDILTAVTNENNAMKEEILSSISSLSTELSSKEAQNAELRSQIDALKKEIEELKKPKPSLLSSIFNKKK